MKIRFGLDFFVIVPSDSRKTHSSSVAFLHKLYDEARKAVLICKTCCDEKFSSSVKLRTRRFDQVFQVCLDSIADTTFDMSIYFHYKRESFCTDAFDPFYYPLQTIVNIHDYGQVSNTVSRVKIASILTNSLKYTYKIKSFRISPKFANNNHSQEVCTKNDKSTG